MQQIAKGIWKIVLGEPETFTPEHFRQFPVRTEAIEQIPVSRECRVSEEKIHWRKTKRGITVTLPMETQEDIYGFGLQLQGFNQAGRRRYIKVNSDPVANTGEGHAPVPFYISSAGYGLFVNTFRYTTFLMGTNSERGQSAGMTAENEAHKEFSEAAIYALKRAKEERKVIIDIPGQGVLNCICSRETLWKSSKDTICSPAVAVCLPCGDLVCGTASMAAEMKRL